METEALEKLHRRVGRGVMGAEILVALARCSLCGHLWTQHDPADGKCDSIAEDRLGACQCGRDLEWMQDRIMANALRCLEAHVIGPEHFA